MSIIIYVYIKDADGPDEVELWATNVDVSAVLDERDERAGGKIVWCYRNAPSSFNVAGVII